jgi:micrococcal nuclease
MKNVFFGILVFVLTSCSNSELPNNFVELGDFVMSNKIDQEQLNYSSEVFSFSTQKFPKKCEWVSLSRVVDGDTVVVSKNTRVRFIGIDTPELKHPNKPIQRFALESSDVLRWLLGGEDKICLISDEIGDKYDVYGRKLAYIFTESGLDINAELIRQGFARGYFSFSFERREEFKSYEAAAKSRKVNLWAK